MTTDGAGKPSVVVFLHISVGGGGSVGEKVKEAMSVNIFKQVTWLTSLLEQKTKLELLPHKFVGH